MKSIFETVDELITTDIPVIEDEKVVYDFSDADSIGHVSAMAESAFLAIKLEFIEKFDYVNESVLFNESAGILNEGFNPFKFIVEMFKKLLNVVKGIFSAIFSRSESDNAVISKHIEKVHSTIEKERKDPRPVGSEYVPEPIYKINVLTIFPKTSNGGITLDLDYLQRDIIEKVNDLKKGSNLDQAKKIFEEVDKTHGLNALRKITKDTQGTLISKKDEIKKLISELTTANANKLVREYLGDSSKIRTDFGSAKFTYNTETMVLDRIKSTINTYEGALDWMKSRMVGMERIFTDIIKSLESIIETAEGQSKLYEVFSTNNVLWKDQEDWQKSIEAEYYRNVSNYYKAIGSSIHDYISKYTQAQGGVVKYYDAMKKELVAAINSTKKIKKEAKKDGTD